MPGMARVLLISPSRVLALVGYVCKMMFVMTRFTEMTSLNRSISATFLAGVMLTLLLLPGQGKASYILDEPILGGHLFVVETGPVIATFLGSDAGYFNRIFLETPGNGLGEIFNKSSLIGAEVNLGDFLAGTELVFRLHVDNTGLDFYSGEGINNPDGLPHLLATSTFVNESGLYYTELGFEDLYGGGDKDYNDFSLNLSNVVDPPGQVPEPLTITLLGLGLAGIGYRQHRSKKTA